MSDFSELCPLFSTGVYKEVTFPDINYLTSFSTTANMLVGTVTAGVGSAQAPTAGVFTFGRTVVVTGAYIQRHATNYDAQVIKLGHRLSLSATPTVFASVAITACATALHSSHTLEPLTFANSATFTSNEILNLGYGTLTATVVGEYTLIVRYREK